MITLSFDTWKGVTVQPTIHTITVLPPRPRPATVPASPNLMATLVHPKRASSVTHIQFSPDGARLFGSGYPSGIVQIFDVAAKKQLIRLDTPEGYKGTDHYGLISPDWKTIYVPVDKRDVETVERNGKKSYRFNYSGEIRVFDATTGKEREPIRPPAGSAPIWAELTPDGQSLIYLERYSHDADDRSDRDKIILCNLTTGQRRTLHAGYAVPWFLPDRKTFVVTNRREIEIRDTASAKTLAKLPCPEKDRFFSFRGASTNGDLLAVGLAGRKAASLEFWFLDAKTLKPRGKLIGDGAPHKYGWGPGEFTPDGKRFVAIDGSGNALVWNVADQKIERRIPLGETKAAWDLTISRDGKKAAVRWSPPRADADDDDDPDPDDLPQPRVSLLDLTGKIPTRVLIAPTHGYGGGLAFSPDGRTLAFGMAGGIHLFDLTK